MLLILFLIYLIFCILVAYYGREVAVGFWGMLIISMILTPLVAALLFLVFRRPRPKNTVVYRYKINDLTNLDD